MILSIIIPIYKAEAFIARCLDSVYNQGVGDDVFEIVAVNDGTPDKSMRIVNEYAEIHPNIKILNKDNGGVSSARNKGIEAATAKYILFLDADDELIESSLKKVMDYLEGHESMDMLVTRQTRFDGFCEKSAGTPSLKENKYYNGWDAYQSHYVRMNAGGGICNTSFLKTHKLKFPEGVRNGEDSVFFGVFQVFANSIVYYNLPLYRINEMNESASRADPSVVGRSFVQTLNEVAKIRKDVARLFPDRIGIMDHVTYYMISNTVFNFTLSKKLSFIEFKRSVNLKDILPLEVDNMCLMKWQVKIMNFSFPIYYFLYWIKSFFKKEPVKRIMYFLNYK